MHVYSTWGDLSGSTPETGGSTSENRVKLFLAKKKSKVLSWEKTDKRLFLPKSGI